MNKSINLNQLYTPPKQPSKQTELVRLLIVICLCAVFIAGEVLGGYLSHSIAIISDALHLVTDFVGFILSFIVVNRSSKTPKNRKYTYGLHGLETVAAILNVFIIWLVVFFLFYQATLRIINREFVQKPRIMLIVGAGGLIANLIMYMVLHGAQKHHHHQHQHNQSEGLTESFLPGAQVNTSDSDAETHQHNESSASTTTAHNHHTSLNIKAAILHALISADIIQSVGVLISSILIYFLGSDRGAEVKVFNSWHFLDPVCTYIFAVLVLVSTIPIAKQCYDSILAAAPHTTNVEAFKQRFLGVEGVRQLHDFHVWEASPGKAMLTAHVVCQRDDQRVVLQKVTVLCRLNKIYHSTIQIQDAEQRSKPTYIQCRHAIHQVEKLIS